MVVAKKVLLRCITIQKALYGNYATANILRKQNKGSFELGCLTPIVAVGLKATLK